MSKLYQRGATWWADYQTPDGERHRHSLRTRDRKVAVERLRLAELAATNPAAHRSLTTLSAAIVYLCDVALINNPEATRRFYRQKCRHLLRLIGDVAVSKIRRADVMAFAQARLAEGAHQHTIAKELVALRRALTIAHEETPLPVHPRDVIPRWRPEYRPRERRLTQDEFGRLMRAAPRRRHLWLMVAVYTGGNLGELERLEWRHVDLVRGQIRLPGTKAKDRDRPVPLAEPLRPWLEGAETKRGLVIGRWANACRDLARYAERARIPPLTPNDLRRTYGSWLVDAGVANYTVAKLMGHATTRMVDTVYGRLSREHMHDAVAKLPDCDAGVSPDPSPSAQKRTIGTPPIAGKTAKSVQVVVPRDGVEPPTRGFSVPTSNSRKASK